MGVWLNKGSANAIEQRQLSSDVFIVSFGNEMQLAGALDSTISWATSFSWGELNLAWRKAVAIISSSFQVAGVAQW